MEESDTEETFSEIVDGVQFDCGIKSQHLVTDTEKNKAILENPYVLIVAQAIPRGENEQARLLWWYRRLLLSQFF